MARAALGRRPPGRRLLALDAGAAQHRLHPLDQQALAERLVHVVVGAEVEAEDLVDLLVLGGQDDHRHVGGPAQAAQHLHAVHARHLHVEDGEVRRIVLQRRQARGAVVVGLDGVAVAFQRQADRRDDVLVVVHQGDLGHLGFVVSLKRVVKLVDPAPWPQWGALADGRRDGRSIASLKASSGLSCPVHLRRGCQMAGAQVHFEVFVRQYPGAGWTLEHGHRGPRHGASTRPRS